MKWGLLYFENDKITIAKKAITQNANLISERSLLLTFIKNKKLK